MPMIDQQGSYRAKATKADLCMTGTGKEQVAVLFEVVEDGPHKGKHITWYGFFTEASMGFTFEKLRTLGWQGMDVSDLSGVGQNGEVEIVVGEDQYNGKTQFKVQFINALGSAGMGIKNVMDDTAKRAFAAKMKAAAAGWDPNAAKAKSAAKTTPQRQPQREEPPPPNDKDIPF